MLWKVSTFNICTYYHNSLPNTNRHDWSTNASVTYHSPRNGSLSRAYSPLVSLNKVLIKPLFLGGGDVRGGRLTSHDHYHNSLPTPTEGQPRLSPRQPLFHITLRTPGNGEIHHVSWSNYTGLTRPGPPNSGLVREIPLFQGNLGSLGPKHFPRSEAERADHLGGFS